MPGTTFKSKFRRLMGVLGHERADVPGWVLITLMTAAAVLP